MPVVVPSADDPRVSILFVLHGGGAIAVDAIAAVVEHTAVPFEVIVVDNCSPDDSVAQLEAGVSRARIVHAGENLGFGQGNNLAASHASAPVIVMLNPDTRVEAGWLEPLLARLDDPKVGAVAPLLVKEDGRIEEAGAMVDRWGMTAPTGRRDFEGTLDVPPAPFVVDYASAACLAMRRGVFDDLGGFDDAYRLAYYEDVDLCFRLWERGLQVWCEPGSRVQHVRGGGGDPATAVELWNHNRSIFLTRWRDELEPRPTLEGSDADVATLARWRAGSRGISAPVVRPGGRSVPERVGLWVGWSLLCVIAMVVLERLHTPRTFWFDEWNFVLDRREGFDTLVQPHNGHLSLLPILVYRIGLALFGLDQYRPFRVAGLLTHVAVATAVVVYVQRRAATILAVAAGGVVLFLGAGWQNIVWPFQMGFMATVALAIVAWLALDRPGRAAALVAAAALAAALACSGIGVAVVIGTAARLAVERSWRRLVLVIVPPTALYGLWYLGYGVSQGTSDNIPRIPRFVVDAAGSGVAALGGRDLLWGRLMLGVLAGVLLVVGLWQRRLRTTIVAPLVCTIANWALTGYSRANFGDPAASRYAYVSAVLVLLIAAEVIGPLLRERARVVPYVSAAAVALAALGVWGNAWIIRAGATGIREDSTITRSELRALEWAADRVAPEYQPDARVMPQLSARNYFDSIDDLGSPAASDGEVAVADAEPREEVDRVSREALRVAMEVPRATRPLDTSVVVHSDDVVETAERCRELLPGTDAMTFATVELPTGTPLAVTATTHGVELRLRRYADTAPEAPFAAMPAGTANVLEIPDDAAPRDVWLVEIATGGAVVLCGAVPTA